MAEWARRVVEIGKLAGWSERQIATAVKMPAGVMATAGLEMAVGLDFDTPTDPAVIAAIYQLCADWLGKREPPVTASRWHTGTPKLHGEYWCEVDALTTLNTRFLLLQWDGTNWLKAGWPYERKTLRWQELDGLSYEAVS